MENENNVDGLIDESPDSENNNQDNKYLKRSVISGVIWKFGERFLAQAISFIVSLVLARLLSPDDYGAVAIVTIFVTIADVFLSSGFSIALIRKKEVTEIDLSSVFYTNLLISIILYFIIFFSAPSIAGINKMPELIWFLRIIALKLPISAYNTVQSAIVSRNMIFKKFFFATLIGTLISAVVGIFMAYKGFGTWSLIAQQLTNLVIDTLILAIAVRWKPKLVYSWRSIKQMFSFGAKNMATDLTGTVFNQLNSIVIGIKYTPADLAFYSKGQQIPSTLNNTISSALTSVIFPAIAKVSDDMEMVKKANRKAIRMLSFVLFPIMVGLVFVTKELVLVLYTEKWSAMIIFMQLMCLDSIISIIGGFDIITLKAIGKSNVTLILEAIKKPIFLIIIFVSMFYGVLSIAIFGVVISALAVIINSFALKKYINYGLIEKIIDCMFPLVASSIMGAVVYLCNFIPLTNNIVILLIKVFIGVFIYLLCSIVSKNSEFKQLINIVKSKLPKKNRSDENV